MAVGGKLKKDHMEHGEAETVDAGLQLTLVDLR
jgi:hypothetical protein